MDNDYAKQIEAAGFIVQLEAECDDTPVRGNAMASGDDEEDRKYEDAIIERVNSGDVWGWATVHVYVSHPSRPEVTGHDVIGGCTYENADDFRKCGYFDDMAREALRDWIYQVEQTPELEAAIETACELV